MQDASTYYTVKVDLLLIDDSIKQREIITKEWISSLKKRSRTVIPAYTVHGALMHKENTEK